MSAKISILPAWHRSLSALLLVFTLAGCGLAERAAHRSTPFSTENVKSAVVGGIDVARNSQFSSGMAFFVQYDPETQRLMPDGDVFILSAHLSTALDFWIIEPGHYVLTSMNLGKGLKHYNYLIDTPDKNALGGYPSDARIGGARSFRVKFSPGELVYVGEYVFDAFKPKWIDRRDEVEALLNEMPHVTAPVIFRPPTERTE